MHVAAEFTGMVVNAGELVVGAMHVVVSRRRESEFNGFVEFLR